MRTAASRLRWAARRLELRAIGLAPEQFSLAEGARAAIAVAVPLVIAVAAGQSWMGWSVFAAFWTCLCDSPGPDRLRRRLLLSFVVFGTGIAFVGSWSASFAPAAGLIAGPLLVFVVILLSSAVAYGALLGTLLAVVAVVAVGFPRPLDLAAVQAVAFLAGAGWAWLLINAIWRIDPKAPLRQNGDAVLARLTDMTSDLLAIGRGSHRDTHWHSEHAEHRRAVRLALERLHGLLDRYSGEPAGVPEPTRRLLDFAETVFSALIALDQAFIDGLGSAQERAAVTRAYGIALRYIRHDPAKLANLRRSRARLGRLRENLSDPLLAGCVVALDEALTLIAERGRQRGREDIVPPTNRPTWREKLCPGLRQAARQSAGVVAVYAAALAFDLGYPYWATMAVVVVLQGGVRSTWTRTIERILGSLLGGSLALALLHVVDAKILLSGVAILLATAAIALRSVNYTAFVVFLTMLFIIVAEMLQPGTGIVSARMLDNVIGSIAALLSVIVFWPELGPSLQTRIARSHDANRAYHDAVLSNAPIETIHRLRRAAGMASIEAEIALHDLGGLLRWRQRLSTEQATVLMDVRRLAGHAAVAWHQRLAASPQEVAAHGDRY
ncbi:FUSC family protein [Rhodopseudomonas telluris]|uniref:FUSC family protein n=1 Tax=Rhodopseudomonas telluris TaxID=644215 RepID=A0ABV6ENY8_9BRAD